MGRQEGVIIIYGFKIFNLDRIKELIDQLGLTDFTTDKEQGMLNNPTINQIVDFVYYECLPFVPFQVLEAFTQQNKMTFFRKSVTDHLYLNIRMRMDFENKLGTDDSVSLYRLLKDQGQDKNVSKPYQQLNAINKCYGDNYFIPSKKAGDLRPDPILFPTFQENLFARTIQSRAINPLYSQVSANYKNVRDLVAILNESVEEGFSGTVSRYTIESNYNFDLLKHIAAHVESTPQIQNINFIKPIVLLGLLPNVFSRNEYIKVLLTHSETIAPNLFEFADHYFQQTQYEDKGIVQSGREKNKNAWRNQYEVKRILGDRLLNKYSEYQQNDSIEYMTKSLYLLSQFTFPIMEMYTYYLLKQVFRVDAPYNNISFPVTSNEDHLSSNQQVIFDLVAPIIYKTKLKSFQLKTQLPMSKKHAESWIRNELYDNPITEEFRNEPLLMGILNSYIISENLVKHCEAEIGPIFRKETFLNSFLRTFDKVRKTKKD
ncbi:hypothetical protein [Paenibacillus sp. IITD108]|uniref:hypothetical protein n=1 Tax=Paenibacillus sp. IITD108 TaxID=3116649 RepID=UPI002F41FABA